VLIAAGLIWWSEGTHFSLNGEEFSGCLGYGTGVW
jgi:hypothetical protein